MSKVVELGNDLLAVDGLPKEATKFQIVYGVTQYVRFFYPDSGNWGMRPLNLPVLSNYEIIGLANSITEEQARELVEKVVKPNEPIYYKVYDPIYFEKDYEHDDAYKNGELIGAAGCYVANALSKHLEYISHTNQSPLAHFEIYDFGEMDFLVNSGDRGDRRARRAGWVDGWLWDTKWDKRKKHDKVRSLVIAGALIAAELDRLNSEPTDKERDATDAK